MPSSSSLRDGKRYDARAGLRCSLRQAAVRLCLANFLDVDEDLVVREALNAGELGLALGSSQVAALEDLDALAALADHHAGTSGVNDDLGLVRGALNLDARNAGVLEVALHRTLDADVFVEPLGVALVVVPLAGPGADDSELKP